MQKIALKNPISKEEVDKMIQKISKSSSFNFLIIDFGNHDFESVKVLKYCKAELMKIEPTLLKFDKIAMLTIPPYKNEDSEKLKYFHEEREAKEWLLMDR